MRIELDELGEGQWIEVKDPKRLPWGKQKQIATIVKEGDVATGLDATEILVMSLVKKGYVLDDDDKPIDFPLDVENISRVPSFIIEKISEIFSASKKEIKPKN
jgi:hypothetical protein